METSVPCGSSEGKCKGPGVAASLCGQVKAAQAVFYSEFTLRATPSGAGQSSNLSSLQLCEGRQGK